MRLITEEVVKKIIKAGKLVVDGELRLPTDCMLTPSAKATVIDHKLELVQDDLPDYARYSTTNTVASSTEQPRDDSSGKGRYKLYGGESIDSKPEHMTVLQNNLLVCKDDVRIFLRGEIDILIAELLKTQYRVAELGCEQLVEDLKDTNNYINMLSHSEVLDEPFEVETVIGLSYAEVQEISHHPKRYFNRGHLFNISYQDGELTLLLNALRALSRRTELAFYTAFKTGDGSVSRPDLMEGFNRLSSIFYILSLRAVSGIYSEVRT